jgi:hypothetical protein
VSGPPVILRTTTKIKDYKTSVVLDLEGINVNDLEFMPKVGRRRLQESGYERDCWSNETDFILCPSFRSGGRMSGSNSAG